MSRTCLWFAALCGALLVVAGCGSGTASGPSRSTLESVGLQLSDFPPSWSRTSAPAFDVLDRFARCTGVKLTKDDAAGDTVSSGVFRNGSRRIWSATTAYHSQGGVTDRVNALGSRRASTCMAQVMRPVVLGVAPGARIVSSHYTVTPGAIYTAATQVGSATGIVSLDSHGRSVKVHVDVSFIGGKNLASDIVFVGVGKAVPGFIRNVLSYKVGKRALQP